MKNFLEKTLRQNVMIEETEYLNEKLPLAFRGRYTFYKVETNGSPWIAIQPKADVGLAALRKDWIKIEKAAGLNCAIFFDSTSFYIKEKLLEEGIPFVLKDKQVYLPFIGYLLSNENERKISPVHLISFLTQKVILVAIYEKWENVTASKAAIRLGVTKMSANRCFDEIEYLNVDILGMKGKSRVITVPADIQKLWNDVRVILRNPVIARYELKEDIQLEKKAGITALCEYSLLSDNEYPTYAITKKEITESGIRKMKQVHSGEEIGCVVLELGYFIDFKNKKLHITKSYQYINGEDIITDPKTEKSRRDVVIPDFLVEELRQFIGMLYGYGRDDRIFQITKSYLHHEMSRGAKAAGVKRIRIHDLRHSHISLLIRLGFSAVAIGNRVGHESQTITFHYAHMFPTEQIEMADKLNEEFVPGTGNGGDVQ